MNQKEKIYEEQVAPLVKKIQEIVKRHEINTIMNFELDIPGASLLDCMHVTSVNLRKGLCSPLTGDLRRVLTLYGFDEA